ncbi:MAG: metallophosphoesterase [Solirubrobacterales bacterium]
MKWINLFLLLSVLALFLLLNYYVGLRAYQGLSRLYPGLGQVRLGYWVTFWLLSVSYLVGRFGSAWFPDWLNQTLSVIGSYWFAVFFYLLFVLLFLDLARLINRLAGNVLPAALTRPEWITVAVMVLVGGTVLYGLWNARHPIVTRYEVTVAKPAGSMQSMRVVMVSDIHLGLIVHNGMLTRLVNMINEEHPDLVLFPGDLIDESVKPFVEQNMADNFQRIKSRYGSFASLGNHEYYSGHIDAIQHYLAEAGVTLLRDQAVTIAGGIVVAGRDDSTREQMTGKPNRVPLNEILKNVDCSQPILIMDHKPARFAEAAAAGVDLQLSGHTHRGQLFPNGFMTQRIFEQDWGMYRNGAFHAIVSCGYGTWGPPIRTGNRPEIVVITIRFAVPEKS